MYVGFVTLYKQSGKTFYIWFLSIFLCVKIIGKLNRGRGRIFWVYLPLNDQLHLICIGHFGKASVLLLNFNKCMSIIKINNPPPQKKKILNS